ncbi:MAG: acyltransferase family protein [Bacteroidia bacterium]
MNQDKSLANVRNIQLDGIRFFAIVLVMVAHWLQWQTNKPIYKGFPFGNGVTLFFVLSGFLITNILLRSRSKEVSVRKATVLKSFYVRRILRIFPLYFITLFFLFFISFKNTREVFPWLATFTTNIYQSIHNTYIGDFNHFWSLAVEEQFYLFWPWLIVFIPAKHSEKIIIGLISISILAKVYLFIYFPDKWMANSYLLVSCMHALGIGALISYWRIYRKGFIEKITKLSVVLTSIVVYFTIHYIAFFYKAAWLNETIDNVLFALMSATIINYAAQSKFEGVFKYILENKFVAYSGKISYGMYIFHLFIPDFLKSHLSPILGINITNKFVLFVTCYLITFVMAHISWILVESPINKLKKYFPYFNKVTVPE